MTAPMVELEVAGLRKVYHSRTRRVEAIRQLSFTVAQGEFVAIVGPSGAGKSTLLRCLSGLLRPTAGAMSLGGSPITGPPQALAMVFQDYSVSLLPWLGVEANVEFPLRRRLDRATCAARAKEALTSVGLAGFERSYPWQLSGGMQQRVAIARALAYRPSVMLMDEPFASVDAQTRAELEDLVLRLHVDYRMTTLFVTHDIDEAIYLADRVLVLSPRPTTIKEILHVDLPRPRDQLATRALHEFNDLRSRAFQLIRGDQAEAVGAELERSGS
jgi:NitT/TauT family transport system ATP-binding protein